MNIVRRIELICAIAVAVLTVVAIGLILFTPMATEVLTTPGQTQTTYIYAVDKGTLPVILVIVLIVVLAAVLLSTVIAHVRQSPQAPNWGIALLGATYLFSSIAFIRFIGGAAQPAGLVALICAIVALIPQRSAVNPSGETIEQP